MIKMAEFAARRKLLTKKMGATDIVILTAGHPQLRNGDATFPFRQQSDFYYLTGFEEPEAILVLLPKNKQAEFILFNRERDRSMEIWDGHRAGQLGAQQDFGANLSFPIREFENKLPLLLEGRDKIHCSFGIDKKFDTILVKTINTLRAKVRNGLQPPITIVDVLDPLHEMRLFKSPAEINLMRKAASLSVDAHQKVMKNCKPGQHEYELEAEFQYACQKQGARFLAYSSIVGSGANTCILHYNDNNQIIEDGSLVLIDAGCEYQSYASDITRTFPANGKFSPEQRAIYEIVLAAQLAAIKAIKPGILWPLMQEIIVEIITTGLVKLGILKGNVKSLIKSHAYLPFYMHKSGHWLGLDVHDAGRYKVHGHWRKLEAGMVLTVEPGIYLSADIKGLPKKWHNIGIRIEDDVLVTKKGYEVLTQQLPKEVHEIEKLMR